MEFIYAKELKREFIVKAKFYYFKEKKCRSLLTIEKQTLNNNRKIIVIMLNPGSSTLTNKAIIPLEIKNHSEIKNINLEETKPDPTQYQIMRVMKHLKIDNATVINLFDLCEPESEKLFRARNINETSIFNIKRDNELSDCFDRNEFILLGWGNLKKHNKFGDEVIKKIEKKGKIYFKKGEKHLVWHPNPRNQDLKIKWLIDIIK